MPPYFNALLAELERLGHDTTAWCFTNDDQPLLQLAAMDPSVGPLVIYDDGDELTLEFGTKYHCHFGCLESDECNASRMEAAAMLAAGFADRILRERIGVAVHYSDRGCTGAALIYLDDFGFSSEELSSSDVGIVGGLIRTERFLWSGPVTNPT